MKITKEQIWYITIVYPELVTHEECVDDFKKEVNSIQDEEERESFVSRWEAIEVKINEVIEKQCKLN